MQSLLKFYTCHLAIGLLLVLAMWMSLMEGKLYSMLENVKQVWDQNGIGTEIVIEYVFVNVTQASERSVTL